MPRAAKPRRPAASRCDLRIEDLYECRPDEFTAARDDLVHALRDAGEADCAARVRALRRPTAAVWAVNQLARRHAASMTALLAAGDRMRAAHRQLGAGDRDALQTASRDHQKLVRTLMTAAAKLLADAGTRGANHVERVGEVLQAEPTASDEVRAQLRSGTLDRELEPVDVSDVLRMMQPSPHAKPKAPVVEPPERGESTKRTDRADDTAKRSAKKRGAENRDAKKRSAKRRETAARKADAEQAERARRARDLARRAERTAARQAERAVAAAERLRGAAERAERAARTARDRADEAARSAERAEAHAAEAGARLAAAERLASR